MLSVGRALTGLMRRTLVQSLGPVRFCSCALKEDGQHHPVHTEYHLDNQVSRLVLNDPKKRNALSIAMLTCLKHTIEDCAADDRTRAIILTGSPPVLCSGHDFRELTSEPGSAQHTQIFELCSDVMKLIQDIPVPVIAEVRGLAAAAGCQLVASCDIVVAADTASFSVPGVKAGLFCSTPGVALARSLSHKIALDMLMTGRSISAQEALVGGLVSRVVPEASVEEEALRVAEEICRTSRPVITIGKSFFYAQIETDRNNAYRQGERVMVENLRLEDCQEGLSGFLEKRKPEWKHTNKTVH